MLHSDPALGPQNYIGYASPEMDRLLVQSRHEMDPARLREICSRIQALEFADQPYTFLYFPILRIALDARFRDVGRSPREPPARLSERPEVVRARRACRSARALLNPGGGRSCTDS